MTTGHKVSSIGGAGGVQAWMGPVELLVSGFGGQAIGMTLTQDDAVMLLMVLVKNVFLMVVLFMQPTPSLKLNLVFSMVLTILTELIMISLLLTLMS